MCIVEGQDIGWAVGQIGETSGVHNKKFEQKKSLPMRSGMSEGMEHSKKKKINVKVHTVWYLGIYGI